MKYLFRTLVPNDGPRVSMKVVRSESRDLACLREPRRLASSRCLWADVEFESEDGLVKERFGVRGCIVSHVIRPPPIEP